MPDSHNMSHQAAVAAVVESIGHRTQAVAYRRSGHLPPGPRMASRKPLHNCMEPQIEASTAQKNVEQPMEVERGSDAVAGADAVVDSSGVVQA